MKNLPPFAALALCFAFSNLGIASDSAGLFHTTPQALRVCATYLPQNEPQLGVVDKCANLGTGSIPKGIATVMTDPVVFQKDPQDPETAYIYSPTAPSTNPNYFRVRTDSENRIQLIHSSNSQWTDSCKDLYTIEAQGRLISKFEPGSPGISGRLELQIMLTDSFEGECQPALTYIAECLKDIQNCASIHDREFADEIFGPYIGTVLNLNDLPFVQKIGLAVSYR